MKTLIHKITLGLALFGAVPSLTAQPLITFDDLPAGMTNGFRVPNGYNGLNWDNFYVNNDVEELPYAPDGYLAGLVSPHNFAFNLRANPVSISSAGNFDLGSGYFTAAWNDNLNLEVKGYNGATLVYDNTYTLSAVSPSLIILNYANVTSVMFTSFGGTHHPGYSSGIGTHFVLDNLQLGLVPEPSCFALGALGGVGLVMARRLGRWGKNSGDRAIHESMDVEQAGCRQGRDRLSVGNRTSLPRPA